MARTICGWTDKLPAGCRDAADNILVAAARAGAHQEDLAVLAAEIYGEGYEYVLMITVVSCGLGAGGWSVDHAAGLGLHGWAGLAVAALAGAGGAVLLLATSWRRGPAEVPAASSTASAPSSTSAP
jgi:hypothetical protein